MDGSRHEAQHIGGCVAIVEHETDDEGEEKHALVVRPGTTLAVGQLVLLLDVVGGRVLCITTMLTSRRCCIGSVRVVFLLACWSACALSCTTMLGLDGGKASVVSVLLHDAVLLSDSLCLNTGQRAEQRGVTVEACSQWSVAWKRIKMWAASAESTDDVRTS